MELSRFLRMYGMNHLDAELRSNLPLREEAGNTWRKTPPVRKGL